MDKYKDEEMVIVIALNKVGRLHLCKTPWVSFSDGDWIFITDPGEIRKITRFEKMLK